MRTVLAALRGWFTFTTDSFGERGYVQNPIHLSRNFRNNTIVMAGALLIGVFVLVRFWQRLPFDSRWLIFVALLSMIGVWGRTIQNHRKIQHSIRSGAMRIENDSLVELIQFFSGAMNFSQYVLYIIALLLLVSLGLAIK